MLSIARHSPLFRDWKSGEGAKLTADELTLDEQPFTGLIRLKATANSAGIAAQRVNELIHCALPEPLQSAQGTHATVIWMSEHDWLIVTNPEKELALAANLSETLAGLTVAVDVVTDSKVSILVGGANSRDLLAVGCRLDLYPEAFQDGRAAQTLLGKVQVLVHKTHIEDQFLIFVDRSYAAFLWTWFSTALGEF